MNNSPTFIRKIIYIGTICVLIIPLALVGRPQGGKQNQSDAGGILSQMRDSHNVSQAKLTEIDAGSEVMKLASLGLRGIAVNVLWSQANEAQKVGDYDTVKSTLESLTKIQPTFVTVWKFQAHNLAYNISVEFDDYQHRFHWVKQGINFLTKGIAYNRRDHRIVDELGFFTGNKIGRSDEKKEFRRLFRHDTDFQDDMSKWHELDKYNCAYGPDNWLLAYQWFDKSRTMVEQGVDGDDVKRRTTEAIYYMKRPAQIRNHAMALQREVGASEYTREQWKRSKREWLAYGNRPLDTGTAAILTLEKADEIAKEIELLQNKLDQLTPPGTRERIMNELFATAHESQLPTEAEKAARKIPFDQRTREERQLAASALTKLNLLAQDLDQRVANEVVGENREKAKLLADDINGNFFLQSTAKRWREIVNYKFWKQRAEAEIMASAVQARLAIFEAKKLYYQGKLNKWIDTDEDGNALDEEKDGSVQLYLKGFAHWKNVFDAIPDLKMSPLSDDVTDEMVKFQDFVLKKAEMEWPENFPLQELIDFRAANNETDNLPTTEKLEKERAMQDNSNSNDNDAKADETSKSSESGVNSTDQKESGENGDSKKKNQPNDLPPSPR